MKLHCGTEREIGAEIASISSNSRISREPETKCRRLVAFFSVADTGVHFIVLVEIIATSVVLLAQAANSGNVAPHSRVKTQWSVVMYGRTAVAHERKGTQKHPG